MFKPSFHLGKKGQDKTVEAKAPEGYQVPEQHKKMRVD